MNRREFVRNTLTAAIAGPVAAESSFFAKRNATVEIERKDPTSSEPNRGALADERPAHSRDLDRHRFGANYTPSKNWWFCWNNWDADPIKSDLDAISALGADHLRILLIWPYFQPNPKWVSPLHLERLEQLLTLMSERSLDAVVTVFTGQLSGWFFLPPFNKAGSEFYTDAEMWKAQELFVRELARVVRGKSNVIGFDFGNELNTCWKTKPSVGDTWMAKMFALMQEAVPEGLHVNGVDEEPWFEENTFSPQALAATKFPIMHCYPYWSGALKYGGPMDPPSTKLLAANAALIRAYAKDLHKPVWAEEFNTCIESLPEKQQAEWLEIAVTAAIEQGVSWFTYWDTHDVDRKFEFNSLEYSLGLMTNDGKVKEQGRVFKRLAETYRGEQVKFPERPIPAPPAKHTQEMTWKWMIDWMGWKR
jgi:endo-1,4-beta-mannosidase